MYVYVAMRTTGALMWYTYAYLGFEACMHSFSFSLVDENKEMALSSLPREILLVQSRVTVQML